MIKRFLSLVLIISSVGVFAQANDPVIMTINEKSYKKSEFEYFYNKYKNEDSVDKLSLTEYIELFKNLKLKVAEAEAQSLDKTPSFLSEFLGYRSDEAKSYLEELQVDEAFVRNKYERMKELVEISHILIAFPEIKNNNYRIFPSDTVEIFQKANQIRNRLLNGENFEKLAKEFSDDTNSSQKERSGYLGWFTGLDLHPQFEETVFTTPAGAIGNLMRSNMGYHIIKVHEKKINPIEINAAHILIPFLTGSDEDAVGDPEKTINDIYAKLTKGADFSTLAKEYSKDPGSAARGGELGFFGLNMMVKEFQDAAFGLSKIGDISKPFKSQFGYHIVKLLAFGETGIEPYLEKRAEIEAKLKNGGFFIPLYKTDFEKMKQEYGFQKDNAGYQMLFSKANTVYPADSVYAISFEKENQTLFSIGNTKYSISEFIDFLKNNLRSPYTLSTEILEDRLQNFEFNSLSQAKDNALESKYPEFRNLVQEYRDGILMFEISDKEIYTKASEDTEGLAAYFNKNKKKYSWSEPQFKGYVVLARDTETKKQMQKDIARKKPDEAVQYLYDNYKVGDVSYVKVEKGLFKKGDNAFVDEEAFKSGKAERTPEFQDFFLIGKLLKAPESYNDVRGMVITDYQNYIEEMWIKKLNEKYKVVVFPEVFNTIK